MSHDFISYDVRTRYDIAIIDFISAMLKEHSISMCDFDKFGYCSILRDKLFDVSSCVEVGGPHLNGAMVIETIGGPNPETTVEIYKILNEEFRKMTTFKS